jgi:hypothetical protein
MINSFKKINPNIIDVFPAKHDGYPARKAREDKLDIMWDLCGDTSREFPRALWLDKQQREDKARENDKNHTWGINYIDRFTNQNPTHECTCHMLRAEMEGARNRALGIIFPDGPKKDFRYEESKRGSVWLSPLSIYSEANPRKTGGANCGQVLNIAIKRGFLPEKIQPSDYGFEHTLVGTTGKGGKNQSSGDWVAVKNFPENWEETAKHFKPLEVIFTTDPEEALCLLLHGYILGYGRNGHAVPPCGWNVASNVIPYTDSYDVVRYDSWATFARAVRSGVHCIASTTTPDDWQHPAGVAA